MKVLLLFPALLYVVIIFMNTGLLFLKQKISIFWIYDIEIPVIAFITIFFVLYIMLIWSVLKFTNIFSNFKNKKLEKEIGGLKSKLLDGQDNLLKEINNNFEKILNKFIEENNKKIEVYKKENEKVISNLEYKIDTFDKKINKLKK